MKLSNRNLFFKVIVSILLSLSCIYLTGTHTHLNYFLLIVFFTLFYKRNLKLYLKGTLPADFVLSIFFLSFSSIEFSSISSFRERAFHLAPLYPSLTIFILIVYYSVLREQDFQLNYFLNNQTYFPFISLLLGFSSGISTVIRTDIGIFSSLHLFSLICFFAINFFLIIKYSNKNDFILKLFPTTFFIFTVLICKSKFSIFTTFALLFGYIFKILESEKLLNYKFTFVSLNFSRIIIIFFAFAIMLINIFSFNMNIYGFNSRYIDNLITYRLTINSSFFQAYKQINTPKFNPQLLPNREYKIINKLRNILEDQSFLEERLNYLPKNLDKRKLNFLVLKGPHNSFMYYLIMHGIFWTIFLLSLIAIIAFLLLIQNDLISISYFIVFCGLLIFESIPYINSLMLIILSYVLILLTKNIFRRI